MTDCDITDRQATYCSRVILGLSFSRGISIKKKKKKEFPDQTLKTQGCGDNLLKTSVNKEIFIC